MLELDRKRNKRKGIKAIPSRRDLLLIYEHASKTKGRSKSAGRASKNAHNHFKAGLLELAAFCLRTALHTFIFLLLSS